MCAKFEVSSYNRSRDMEDSITSEVSHVTPFRPLCPNFAFFSLVPLVIRLHAKFEVSIAPTVPEIWRGHKI